METCKIDIVKIRKKAISELQKNKRCNYCKNLIIVPDASIAPWGTRNGCTLCIDDVKAKKHFYPDDYWIKHKTSDMLNEKIDILNKKILNKYKKYLNGN